MHEKFQTPNTDVFRSLKGSVRNLTFFKYKTEFFIAGVQSVRVDILMKTCFENEALNVKLYYSKKHVQSFIKRCLSLIIIIS